MAGGARKARLARGVTVNGAPVTFRLTEPEGPAEPVDLVILAVKDYAYREALEQVGPFVGETPILLPVLNGLDCARQAGEVYGPEKVLYASMWVDASMENGTAVYNPRGMVRIGEARNDPPGPRVLALEGLFRRAGVRCRVEPDMIHCIWLKFMGNVSENLPCALLGVPYGAYREGWPADGDPQGPDGRGGGGGPGGGRGGADGGGHGPPEQDRLQQDPAAGPPPCRTWTGAGRRRWSSSPAPWCAWGRSTASPPRSAPSCSRGSGPGGQKRRDHPRPSGGGADTGPPVLTPNCYQIVLDKERVTLVPY